VVSEQVALYETITREHRATPQGGRPAADPDTSDREAEDVPGADVLPMRRPRKKGKR
jgi:hypothetical protein